MLTWWLVTGLIDEQRAYLSWAELSLPKPINDATGTLAGAGAVVDGTASRTHVFDATGAITGPGSTVDGTASSSTDRASSGMLAGAGAVVAGEAARTRVFDASGDLVGPGAVVTGDAARPAADGQAVSTSRLSDAGSNRRGKRRRYEVQLDDQVVTVGSPEEAFALLADVRKLAAPTAQREVSVVAEKSEPATWTVPPPVITIEAEAFDAFAGLRKALERTNRELERAYKDALRAAGIAYWMREAQERDDEEVLLLLH